MKPQSQLPDSAIVAIRNYTKKWQWLCLNKPYLQKTDSRLDLAWGLDVVS